MKRTTIARLLPAALFTLGSGAASAAGFQLLEQNASGIGNSYAGSAAVAENASTIFFNPAGMTQLQAREVSLGVSAVRPSFKFKDKGSVGGALSGNGDDAGDWGAIPNAYLSWALNKDLYLGLGISAPFGLATDYDGSWVGGAQATKFEIKTVNINPSLAWRVSDKVSLGAGVNWQRMEAQYERILAVSNLGPVPLASSMAKLDVDNDAWGWNVGALFTLSPTTKVGVSYRSKIDHKLDGDLKVEGPAAQFGGIDPRLRSAKAKVDVELPDTFIISTTQKLSDRWEMLGDLSWTGWSSVKDVPIVRDSGLLAGSTAQTLEADFKDTWRVALGANYLLNEAWKLKFGIAYDQTPVKDKERRLVSLPDNDRTWFSAGAQWKVSKTDTLDLGAAYLYVPKTRIDNNQLSDGRGRVTGDYDASVWVVGAQYSMAF